MKISLPCGSDSDISCPAPAGYYIAQCPGVPGVGGHKNRCGISIGAVRIERKSGSNHSPWCILVNCEKGFTILESISAERLGDHVDHVNFEFLFFWKAGLFAHTLSFRDQYPGIAVIQALFTHLPVRLQQEDRRGVGLLHLPAFPPISDLPGIF